MVCSQCHTPNFRDYKYCRECGTRLEAAESSGPVDEHAEVEELLRHAFTQMNDGELEKALGTVQAALAHDPENPSAHSALGLVYERQGLIQDAIHQFRVVLQLSPDSTADREKLQQLLARGGRESEATFFTPMRLAVASAVAASVVTFGVGLALTSNRPAKASGPRQSAGSLLPATTMTVQPSPKPAPLTPIKTGATPAAGTLARVTPAPQAAARPHTPTYTPPPAPSPLALIPTFSGRDESRPTPPAPWRPRTQSTGAGLQAAKIGEVVPLSRPDFSHIQAMGQAQPAPKTTPEPQTRPQPKPRVEPLEPETGFIKIEPIEKPGQPQGGAAPPPQAGAPSQPAPAPENPRPSISITISPGSR